MDILDEDARALSGALERGDVSAVEVMQATLARINAVNPQVNAIVSLRDGDALLAEAQAADSAPRKGWLHGIPIAIKDLANARGLPTSKGSPLFEGQIAQQDDVMVKRLRDAGALIIGKTNTPEFGLGSHTFNPVHGATCNPYDLGRSAGGSSGGAAAALAARMLTVADGSDMMGSLRNPAGWNNVYGMRPTWGTIPGDADGDVFLHQLSTLGPMARCPQDLAALLDTMTGADAAQPLSTSPDATLPMLTAPLPAQRIGYLGDWEGALPYEAGIAELSDKALQQMSALGHHVINLPAPFDADQLWESWITLRSFAVAGGSHALYADSEKRKLLKPAAIWEIERGLAMSAMQVNHASMVRSDWLRAVNRLFEQVDVLVLPSAQCWPFDVNAVHPTEIAGVAMDTYHRWMQVVIPAGLIGLPVVNIPAGFGENGLPGGLQLIGRHGSDGQLLKLAQHWHTATDWPRTRAMPG
ncbi:amidase [Sulfitobacter sp. M57]|uniref:amidase n=1 Tax=unclassified Sulfitobacter TaxID=196795 RepID=UPI0023E2FF23|nr:MULTISPECIES: amidase [unclassified Sulfitobacter]MDF3413538.1 amidase [Sulfitobacter sp. KE5]MDF3421180.1 amidase [Sulfitobacter sp. KE43]MDF3432085.1 amidase [Sulfitobacter sp. KE42]MDF3457725.1 amidase [Sulfitobacter sp. S74]MDF3461626.1 amidase [Sulfitobacter sp. Ks18]